MMMRSMLIAVSLLTFFNACPSPATAQYFKGKTITILVNFPAGGPTDIEARIVAHHLPEHIPGNPVVMVRNVVGAGGLLATNQLGKAPPNGETIGFVTVNTISEIIGEAAMQTPFSDLVVIGGVESPLVVYMRKDTPPGLTVPADVVKANDFKALSIHAQNTNTVNQLLGLDLLGVKYHAVPAFRGLRQVETAILQDFGQLANTSLSGWLASVEPTMGKIVMPLWQLAPRKGNTYPRSKAIPDILTFEELYAQVYPGKPLANDIAYQSLRAFSDPQLGLFRAALLPPNASGEPVELLRSAFVQMWRDPKFLASYAKVSITEPILVTGNEGQEILSALGKVRPEIREFLTKYIDQIVKK